MQKKLSNYMCFRRRNEQLLEESLDIDRSMKGMDGYGLCFHTVLHMSIGSCPNSVAYSPQISEL